MRIDGKRIIAFILKRNENGYEIHLADTENKTDEGYKKICIAVSPDTVDRIADLVSDDRYAFVGYGNRYNDNIILNYIISNRKLMKNFGSKSISEHLDKMLETTLGGEDKDMERKYKYASMFNSFDLQKFLFSKDEAVTLEQFVNASDFEHCGSDYDVDNIANILDENKPRIDARLKIEEMYGEDLFDSHESTVGPRLVRSLYAKKNNMKLSDVKTNTIIKGSVSLSDVIMKNIGFNDNGLLSTIDELAKESIDIENRSWMKYMSFREYEFFMNIAGVRMNTKPKMLKSDNEGEVFMIDIASFYPSIMTAYRIIPEGLNSSFIEIFGDMLSKRLLMKSSDKECSDSMKMMLVGTIGQLMIEGSWLYDPLASLKIRINGALLMMSLMEFIYDIAEIHCMTIDGMFVKTKGTGRFKDLKEAVERWSVKSKLSADIIKYKYVYMLSNNDYVTDTTSKGFFSYHGNNGRRSVPNIIRVAVTENLTNGTPIDETVLSDRDVKDYLMSISSTENLEWNGCVFKTARYFCSSDQKLCKFKDVYPMDQTLVPVTDYGVTLVGDTGNADSEEIDYRYYISEANKIADKIKVQQLTLF